MSLIDEMDKEGIKLPSGRERVRCRVFKDNVRVKVIVTITRIRTHTKHINFKYWLFIEYMNKTGWNYFRSSQKTS